MEIDLKKFLGIFIDKKPTSETRISYTDNNLEDD